MYKSGENISTSNNQSPVLSPVAAEKIHDLFCRFSALESCPLPRVSEIRAICLGGKETAPNETILRIIDERKMLAWGDLPRAEYVYGDTKTLTFILDHRQITVTNDRWLPLGVKNGFFEIELEMMKT